MNLYNDDNSVTILSQLDQTGCGWGWQWGNKKNYGDQVSVVCSHCESCSVFVSQWDVVIQIYKHRDLHCLD